MDTINTENTETFDSNPRPQFLKVICILSFIMCGLMLLFGLMGIKNLFMSAEDILGMNPYMKTFQENDPAAYQTILDSMQYKDINAILGLVIPLISLMGVIQMWKLKKSGFLIYVVGEILPYLSIAATSGLTAMYASTSAFGEKGETIMNAFIGMVIVFDILFIILYALNLKHMK